MPTPSSASLKVDHRITNNASRINSLLLRCTSLESEAGKLVGFRKNQHNLTRGLFVEEIVREAQSKLVEAQIVCDKLCIVTDESEARLATVARWVDSAADLVNRAIRVLDEVEDVFGKPLPTGGLWDK